MANLKIVVSPIGSYRNDNKDKITTYSDSETGIIYPFADVSGNKETSVPQGGTEVNSDGGATGLEYVYFSLYFNAL